MLAVRAHAGRAEPQLDTVPVPVPGPDDVLVRIVAAGITPGMLRVLALGRLRHLPTVLGAEGAGTIAAIGANVGQLRVGDRVRLHPNLNCARCIYCRTDRDMMCPQQAIMGHGAFGDGDLPRYARYHDGALADYVRAPHWQVDPLPDGVGFSVGAKINHFATAARTFKCAGLASGATVMVTAPTGSIGAATLSIARSWGIARLILVGRSRRHLHAVAALAGDIPTELIATTDDLASDWADTGALTTALRDRVPAGADAIIDYTPAGPTITQCLPALATGGTLVHLGSNGTAPPIPLPDIMMNCWRIVGMRGNTRTDAAEVLRLLATGAVQADRLITHRYALSDALTGLRATQSRNGTDPTWMVIATPDWVAEDALPQRFTRSANGPLRHLTPRSS